MVEYKPTLLIVDDIHADKEVRDIVEACVGSNFDVVICETPRAGHIKQRKSYTAGLEMTGIMGMMMSMKGFRNRSVYGEISDSFDNINRHKPKTECLYEPCTNLTDHNKGYCSSKCFKLNKEK